MEIRHLRDNPVVWQTLEERARALAVQELDADSDRGEETIFFKLGAGTYGLPAHFVREVQPLGGFTPLPATPAFVIGLVNVRGRLYTALDIRPLLDIPAAPPQNQAYLLIINANNMDVALLADSVIEVSRGAIDLAPSIAATTGRGIAWVRGVDQRLNLLIDPALLMADQRLVVNDTMDT